MAIQKRNYIPGEHETVTQVYAGDVTGSDQYFALEGYFKHEMADLVVYAGSGKALVNPSDYALHTDDKYTAVEVDYSGKTLVAMIRFNNPSYTGEPFYVTGLNFGSMVDNEDMKRYIDNSGVQSDWSETDSGLLSFIKNKPAVVQSDWSETGESSPAFIKNKPLFFSVKTGSELGVALTANYSNKVIFGSNNQLEAVGDALVVPLNTTVRGNNYIYGCPVSFSTFNNTVPEQIMSIKGFSAVYSENIFMHCDFVHWSKVGYPNNVNIDSVQVHLRNVRTGDISGGNVSYNVTDSKNIGAFLKYEKTDQFGLTPDGVLDVWDSTQRQVDWDQENYTKVDYLKNKPLLKLPGVDENKEHIVKIDNTHIAVFAGSGRMRKDDKSQYPVEWDSISSVEIVVPLNELRWVFWQWNTEKTDVELVFRETWPSTLAEFEKNCLIGRVWDEDGVLFASGRHLCLSVDPYANRSDSWVTPAENISVVGGASAVDSNYLALASGELKRWPVAEFGTGRHVFQYVGNTQVLTMWDHLQGQAAHGIVSDSASGLSDDITKISSWYDNGGTLAAVPNKKWVVHLVGVYAVSGVKVLYRAQKLYDNVGAAKVGIYSDTLVESDWAADGRQISKVCWVIMKEGAVDFGDSSKVIFVPYGIAGGGGGALGSLFVLNFSFSREGFTTPNYSGGYADLPKSDWTEDSTTTDLTGRGLEVRAAAESVLTVASFGFGRVAGDVTVYVKVNGARTDLGTIVNDNPGGEIEGDFYPNIPLAFKDKIIFGFSSAATGEFVSPSCEAYIRTVGV